MFEAVNSVSRMTGGRTISLYTEKQDLETTQIETILVLIAENNPLPEELGIYLYTNKENLRSHGNPEAFLSRSIKHQKIHLTITYCPNPSSEDLVLLEISTEKQFTPHQALIEAISSGNARKATELLSSFGMINEQDEEGWPPLMYAVRYDLTSVARMLIDKGASVNVQAKSGMTPLMIAAYYGRDEAVTMLINCGADINLSDHFGHTALIEAVLGNKPEIVKVLLFRGARADARTSNGNTALDIARLQGKEQIVRLFEDQ